MRILKSLLLITTLLTLNSCYTYIDYKYKGYETIEYIDTIHLNPIHYHYKKDSLNDCIWVDEFKHPYKSVYIIESWEIIKKRSIKKK
jgi:hypothetical protein